MKLYKVETQIINEYNGSDWVPLTDQETEFVCVEDCCFANVDVEMPIMWHPPGATIKKVDDVWLIFDG